MPDTSKVNDLEAARTRLETALSALTQGVASTRGALDVAVTMADEKAQMTERIAVLERENLKLHEQVAALALKPATSETHDRLENLEQEKAALEQNYQLLKARYEELQDAQTNTETEHSNRDDSGMRVENERLTGLISNMELEKATLQNELDQTIAELEALLEST